MFVQTADMLQEAVISGIRHIIVESHLDLRTLPADPSAQVAGALLVITSKTKSIRVRDTNDAILHTALHLVFVSTAFSAWFAQLVECGVTLPGIAVAVHGVLSLA